MKALPTMLASVAALAMMAASIAAVPSMIPLADDPIASALAHYATIDSYRLILRTTPRNGAPQTMRYAFRKPDFVRIEFVEPHSGAVIVYDPLAHRAMLWPFGSGHFPRLSLDPGNPLIRGPGGQTVDRSDVGALLSAVQALRKAGTLDELGEEAVDGRPARHVAVEAAKGQAIAGVHRYELWLDRESLFPLKVVSRDTRGELIESVLMNDIELNVRFPDGFFER